MHTCIIDRRACNQCTYDLQGFQLSSLPPASAPSSLPEFPPGILFEVLCSEETFRSVSAVGIIFFWRGGEEEEEEERGVRGSTVREEIRKCPREKFRKRHRSERKRGKKKIKK